MCAWALGCFYSHISTQTASTGLRHPSFHHWFTTSFLPPLVYDILPSTTGLRHPSFNHWFTTSFLQPLVYDILPSTTAVFSYVIGSRKRSANEQLFVGAQTAVSLLRTTLIKQGVSFIAVNRVYNSANKTGHNSLNRDGTLSYPGWMRLMFTCLLWR